MANGKTIHKMVKANGHGHPVSTIKVTSSMGLRMGKAK